VIPIENKLVEEKATIVSNFQLNFGETHEKLFQLEKGHYSGELEIGALFDKFTIDQRNLCEMIYGYEKKNPSVYAAYQNIHSGLEENKWLSKIIAGCWNFYSMNDIGVENDFLLVKELYSEESLDCYSVGFMQPYIMHGILGCKRLFFLDIDWKIIESHFWLFRDFATGVNDNGIDWARYKETINWDIGLDMVPRKMKENLGYETVCGNYQSLMCRKAMDRMIAKKSELEEVRFNLGFLHEGKYDFQPGRVTVVYTSNALDPGYTSRKEFKKFLKLLGKAMEEDNKMVMIYHAGGRRAFGVYEITREENYLKVFAVCRDNYTYGSVYKNAGESYSIYLDDYTKSQKNIPECRSVLRKKKPVW
jgi:hypothetical protein